MLYWPQKNKTCDLNWVMHKLQSIYGNMSSTHNFLYICPLVGCGIAGVNNTSGGTLVYEFMFGLPIITSSIYIFCNIRYFLVNARRFINLVTNLLYILLDRIVSHKV